MSKTLAALLACGCVLASCSWGGPSVPATASGTGVAGSGGELPAVTDQEIDQLIDTVMQGIDVPN